MERINEDRTQELARVKQTADQKRSQADELALQIKRVKEEAERTTSIKLNEQERKEIEFNIKVGQVQDELRVLRDQKSQAERLLLEKADNIRLQEEEITKREDKLRRWEREMQRLENKAVQETEKSLCVQGEYDRLRSMRVDDALLIERLRSQLGEIQDALNEIVGVFSAFEMSQDYNLKPLRNTDEIIGFIRELRQNISILQASQQHLREDSPPQKEYHNVNERANIEQVHHEREKQIQLRSQLDGVEEQLNNEKHYIQDLEAIIKKIAILRSLSPKLSVLISESLMQVKDLGLARYDKASLSSKLEQREQRYLTLSTTYTEYIAIKSAEWIQFTILQIIESQTLTFQLKFTTYLIKLYFSLHHQGLSSASAAYQRELSMLKNSIDRDRTEVRLMDKKVEDLKRKLGSIMDDMASLDSVLPKPDGTEDFRVHGLAQEIEELKKVNRLLQDEKEWNQNRLMELESQLNQFKMPGVTSSLRKRSIERSPIQDHQSDNREASRLYWPKMMIDQPPKGLNRQDNISFGQIHHPHTMQQQQRLERPLSSYSGSRDYPRNHTLTTPAQRMTMAEDTPGGRVSSHYSGNNNLDYVPSRVLSRGASETRSDAQSTTLQDKMNKVKTMFTQLKRNITVDQ